MIGMAITASRPHRLKDDRKRVAFVPGRIALGVIEFALPAGHWTVAVRKQSYVDLRIMAWQAKLSKLRL
jgi:hypothetical protein